VIDNHTPIMRGLHSGVLGTGAARLPGSHGAKWARETGVRIRYFVLWGPPAMCGVLCENDGNAPQHVPALVLPTVSVSPGF